MEEKKDHLTENTMNTSSKRPWITPEIVEEDYTETEAGPWVGVDSEDGASGYS